jgi:hypothetical protein
MLLSFERIMQSGVTRRRIIIFVVSLFILAFIKVYVMVLLAPGLVTWWFMRKSTGKKVVLAFASVYLVFFIVAFNLYHINDEYNVAALLFYKQKNFIEIGIEHSAKMLPAINYECSGPSIAAHTPIAICNVLFRPFLWEAKNPTMLLSALENTMLLLMIVLFFVFSDFTKPAVPVIMVSVIFVVCLFALVGLITPVLGAIVRYRIVGIPFLIFFLLFFFDKERMKKSISTFGKSKI